MHDVEPYFQWRHLYIAAEDPRSLFFGRTYSEFEFSQTVYNYYIHPQWDEFGSKNLFMLDIMMQDGIYKFILIGEHVYNFHNGDRDYYEELYDELADENGWAVMVNLHPAAQYDFLQKKLNRYIELMEIAPWRTYKPEDFFQLIDQKINQRLID